MGKTLGFGVPLLQRLAWDDGAKDENGKLAAGRAPRALVMVPTRELCVQVTRDLQGAAKYLGLSVTAVYGGRAYEPQIAALQSGVDVVIGTPGRLLDLANGGHLQLGGDQGAGARRGRRDARPRASCRTSRRCSAWCPDVKQTMLFSATMPGPILTLARSFMSQPTHIRAEVATEGQTHRTTKQFVYRAHALDKVEMLARLLQARGRGLTMVFTRTKRTAQKVSDELAERGFAAAAVHGDLGQGAREQALRAFRAGKVDVLVATDVAARGIDVEDVTHVVNYQCPEDDKTYVHRIGRTGRAGKTGVAVTFVDWDDIPRWKLINDSLGLDFADPVETYSNSPHFFADLDIPEGTTGRLPKAQRTRAGPRGRGRRGPRRDRRAAPQGGNRPGAIRRACRALATRGSRGGRPNEGRTVRHPHQQACRERRRLHRAGRGRADAVGEPVPRRPVGNGPGGAPAAVARPPNGYRPRNRQPTRSTHEPSSSSPPASDAGLVRIAAGRAHPGALRKLARVTSPHRRRRLLDRSLAVALAVVVVVVGLVVYHYSDIRNADLVTGSVGPGAGDPVGTTDRR